MGIEPILNYRKISERISTSGQPGPDQFRAIADAGFDVVINLAMPDSTNAIPEEGSIVGTLGMIYIHIPVPFDAPSVSHLKCFVKILRVISSKKVWVHCALNYRASAFIYQYWRKVYGATPEDARKLMLPSWVPDPVWQDFMAISTDRFG